MYTYNLLRIVQAGRDRFNYVHTSGSRVGAYSIETLRALAFGP